jgi:hypothetical protein
LGSDIGGHSFHFIRASGGAHHGGASGGQRVSDALADAPTGAGHHGHVIGQVEQSTGCFVHRAPSLRTNESYQ